MWQILTKSSFHVEDIDEKFTPFDRILLVVSSTSKIISSRSLSAYACHLPDSQRHNLYPGLLYIVSQNQDQSNGTTDMKNVYSTCYFGLIGLSCLDALDCAVPFGVLKNLIANERWMPPGFLPATAISG